MFIYVAALKVKTPSSDFKIIINYICTVKTYNFTVCNYTNGKW